MIISRRAACNSPLGRSVCALAAAALLVAATGCGADDRGSAGGGAGSAEGGGGGPSSHPVTDTTITAAPGERFTLTVEQNASTREYWYLVGPRPDSSVLVSRGKAYAPDAGEDGRDGRQAPGSGGRLTFTFEARGEGVTRLTLLHCTFTTCRGNTAPSPPVTSGSSATPATGATSPSRTPERVTYTVTVR